MCEKISNNTIKILVVDDNPVVRKLATTLLAKKNYDVTACESGRQGIEKAKTLSPHVILLDVMMPEIDGYEVCRKLQLDDITKDIPIIMVSSKTESIDKIKGLEHGAADYVTKPFDRGELLARVATQVRMKTLWDELQEKNSMLEELAKKDGLTNLFNHRHFQERIAEEFYRSKRYSLPLCCALIDIDHFKTVNDNYGHQAGDVILNSLGGLFEENKRDIDSAARYGGEEFALILPHTDKECSRAMCERLCHIIQEETFLVSSKTINITVSIGIAAYPDVSVETHSELIKCADEALYAAKKSGRNRVVVYSKDLTCRE